VSLDVLLAGVLGALLVFFLGVLREWWREEQERRGLLILLLADLEHNAEVIRTIYDRMDPGQAMEELTAHPHFANQKAKTWEGVQERAAALLPDDLMEALQEYYAPLEALLTLVRFPTMASDGFARTLREQLDKLLKAQDDTPRRSRDTSPSPGGGSGGRARSRRRDRR
jgi:hypothetical protein